ncbi:hypothetical protein B296_00031643 [Ensete ventricosum]|uniref:Uncharacterized protein n=1 Tax=Ensete ventricosum TaxID=4639 RepID=A0A426YCU8_ENSVE|nr:hypothetical protein B296_00031643 [Ensete ventricosum]
MTASIIACPRRPFFSVDFLRTHYRWLPPSFAKASFYTRQRLPPPSPDPLLLTSSSPSRIVSLPGKVEHYLLFVVNLKSTNPNHSPFHFSILVLASHHPLRRWLLPPLGDSIDALFHGSRLLLSVASVFPSSPIAT